MSSDWSRIKIAPIMRDLATGMLGVYHFGNKLSERLLFWGATTAYIFSGKEPHFSTAMSQYYEDTVACMGAFQVVPTFMQPYSLLPRRWLAKDTEILIGLCTEY